MPPQVQCTHGYEQHPVHFALAQRLAASVGHGAAADIVRMEQILREHPDTASEGVALQLTAIATTLCANGCIAGARDVYRLIPVVRACAEHTAQLTFEALRTDSRRKSPLRDAIWKAAVVPTTSDFGLICMLRKDAQCTCLHALEAAYSAPRAPSNSDALLAAFKALPARDVAPSGSCDVGLHIELRDIAGLPAMAEYPGAYDPWLGTALMLSCRYSVAPIGMQALPLQLACRKVSFAICANMAIVTRRHDRYSTSVELVDVVSYLAQTRL
eukprot:6534-Heterococcus_DN1.PRE.4